MKSTGIVRKVDSLGRINLPKELRDCYNIHSGDCVEIFTEGNTVIFRKFHPGCCICGNLKNLHIFRGKRLCKNCIDDMTKK